MLDVACGSGRHKQALVVLGYTVVGVDNDPAVSPDVLADMRRLDHLPSDFDAVLNLWASFGYFGEDENAGVLATFARRLRPYGRVVLDLYNREFFERRPREERTIGPGVLERSEVVDSRRRVELRYPDGQVETFDWQLFSAADIVSLGAPSGLAPLHVRASPDRPAMQIVLERQPAAAPANG